MAAEDYLNWDGDDEEQEDLVIKVLEWIHETEKARLVRSRQGKFWVPKSISRREEDCIIIDGWFNPEYLKE